MNRLLRPSVFFIILAINLMVAGCSPKESSDAASTAVSYSLIEWTDLLPAEDLDAIMNPPEYIAEIEDGSEADQLTDQLKSLPTNDNDNDAMADNSLEEDRYQQALASTNIKPEFNGSNIKIPGFIVPLEFDDQQTITTFFLVPFFGACIHMPPPPPNQIIYAEYEPGIRLDALYDAFVISGTMSTTMVENDMATAAYSMTVSAIEPYAEVENELFDENTDEDQAIQPE